MNPVPEVAWMLDLDPPEHTRLRKLVNKAFTPRLVSAMEPRLRSIADQLLASFRNQPVLLPQFIEEVLRFESPIQCLFRQATGDIDIAGATIPAGARVLLLNGSANRDEAHFQHADQFALAQNPSDHLAFGYGIHYCLGAQLARLEARVALDALLFGMPPFSRQTETVERIRVLNLRGPQTLPLVWAE